jgi:hypothetical protein
MRAWMALRSAEKVREAAPVEGRAAKVSVAEARVDGKLGQQAGAEMELSVACAEGESSGMAQWCLPFLRQQAGRRDSITFPVQPEARAAAGTAAMTGPRLRTNVNRMERIRRIRVYRTSDFNDCHCCQVLSENQIPS